MLTSLTFDAARQFGAARSSTRMKSASSDVSASLMRSPAAAAVGSRFSAARAAGNWEFERIRKGRSDQRSSWTPSAGPVEEILEFLHEDRGLTNLDVLRSVLCATVGQRASLGGDGSLRT